MQLYTLLYKHTLFYTLTHHPDEPEQHTDFLLHSPLWHGGVQRRRTRLGSSTWPAQESQSALISLTLYHGPDPKRETDRDEK